MIANLPIICRWSGHNLPIAICRIHEANLPISILSKAFRGESVPQDPRDEPASELLARIRTTREELEAEKKATKKKTTRRKAKS